MADMLLHYKIRSRTTGLYSTGGKPPSWSKNGKTWTNIGGLMSHFNYLKEYTHNKNAIEIYRIPSDWEIITIEIRAYEAAGVPVADFIRDRRPNATIIIK